MNNRLKDVKCAMSDDGEHNFMEKKDGRFEVAICVHCGAKEIIREVV